MIIWIGWAWVIEDTEIWAVPLDGSSNIILSTIEKGGGLADYCLWEGVYLESDCIREKIHRCRKISERELGMGFFAPFSYKRGILLFNLQWEFSESFASPPWPGEGGGGFASKCRIRSTKTGGQLSLLDWGGGWAFISVDVKSVAMVQCQLFPTKF